MAQDAQLEAARGAVRAAHAVCGAVAARIREIATLTKDDASPVTLADFASQAVVVHWLRSSLADVTVVGEENASMLRGADARALLELVVDAARVGWPEVTADALLQAIDAGSSRAASATYWTLDPIDGTKGFLRGGQYAVSLCHVVDGVPELGVLGCPALAASRGAPLEQAHPPGTLYWARRDRGAFEQDLRTEATRALDPHLTLGEGRVTVAESVESGHTRHDHTAQILEHLGLAGTFARLDGQGKYAVVARGQADAYLRMPTRPAYREKVWDHAAGVLVAEEAGVTVTDIAGRPLDFSMPPELTLNRGIVCARGTLHPRIVNAIAALGLFPET